MNSKTEERKMFIKDWKKEIFTIPNLLSLFRLLLIPVYITIYLNAKNAADFYIAAGILAVSCITDLIDGKIPVVKCALSELIQNGVTNGEQVHKACDAAMIFRGNHRVRKPLIPCKGFFCGGDMVTPVKLLFHLEHLIKVG